MNVIIIDDEVKIIELVEQLIKTYYAQLNVLATCSTAEEGIKAIHLQKPDLIFMDVQLVNHTAFDILQSIDSEKFKIIVISGQESHAVNMFDFNILAYLLKPIQIPKFLQAVNKAIELNNKQDAIITLKNNALEYLAATNGQEKEIIQIANIIKIEALGNYSLVYLINNTKKTLSKQIGDIEKLLPSNNFIRVHDSFIINITCIVKILKGKSGTILLNDNTEIPISNRRKNVLKERIGLI
jgi:two-component system, LytTR family, response regulator